MMAAVALVPIAENVWVLTTPPVNWVLVAGERGLTAIDAGLPASWDQLNAAITELGRLPGELRGVVLTHGHLDHTGFAARAQRELGAEVLAHPDDTKILRRPLWPVPSERLPLPYLRHASARCALREMIAGGARHAEAVTSFSPLVAGAVLDLPGRPVVVGTPGHSPGHCSIHLPEPDVVVAGDALVTWDPYTGATGPRLVARASTWSSAAAERSLDALAATGAGILVPGHGDVWREGAARAVELARQAVQG